MRFKTIIELKAEAKNKFEAYEIVEEYLAGNIVSGVDMKCVTKPVVNPVKVAGIAMITLAILAGIIIAAQMKHPMSIISSLPGVSAVQPPLKTSVSPRVSDDFKKEWQDMQTKEALSRITK